MQIKTVYPESAYAPAVQTKCFFRGEQLAGDVQNLVPSGPLLVKSAGITDAQLWATTGYATVGGAAGRHLTLVPSAGDLDKNKTIIIALRVQKSAAAFPAAEHYMVSSYNPGTNNSGFIISCRMDGAVRLYLNATDNGSINVSTAAGAITDGTTANERSILFAIPREAGSAQVYLDAIAGATAATTNVHGKSLAGGRALFVGGPQSGIAIDAFRIKHFGVYEIAADSSAINMLTVAAWHLENPGLAAPSWVFA